ncbi:MAG: hypothetical protein HZA54_13045, partial [Planctomycetes bacterium]|nr:hypothetical protein [Planctomycetota bacterium]
MPCRVLVHLAWIAACLAAPLAAVLELPPAAAFAADALPRTLAAVQLLLLLLLVPALLPAPATGPGPGPAPLDRFHAASGEILILALLALPADRFVLELAGAPFADLGALFLAPPLIGLAAAGLLAAAGPERGARVGLALVGLLTISPLCGLALRIAGAPTAVGGGLSPAAWVADPHGARSSALLAIGVLLLVWPLLWAQTRRSRRLGRGGGPPADAGRVGGVAGAP